ncbi:MAG TPA: hypothetical protein VMV72_02800 [Verrucomicrobiae bacterium]|nr:hypothetical protein [Verrucomicrobiae bacterium]
MLAFSTTSAMAGQYTNFAVAVYIPVGVVRSFEDSARLSNEWARISSQVKVDKVYIEVQRDRNLAGDELLERVKQFFLQRGVRVAGGMALSDNGHGQFRSFCYTDPADRQFVKNAVELAARHFDEIIQDDFFFVTTKYDSDIAAKGKRGWTEFRLDLMRDAAENLIIKPARAVNPKVELVIKFPNWYEHFQGLGYDLGREPQMFDGIYTGTETRDPEITDQNLQQYESYQIFRYFENIAPGRNGGGWVDTFSIRYLDRYAEQLWDTLFAKAPEITLFEWSGLLRPITAGNRAAWENFPTSFHYGQMMQSFKPGPAQGSEPTMARVAGYSLEQVDAFLGKLGNPIGIASYKPYQSAGEDFLHNYLGMIGVPIDLHPSFPTNANLVLLTESAAFDPGIVAKIKGHLAAGKSVVITSGLLRALQDRGIEDIVEARCTERRFLAHEYLSSFGAGNSTVIGDGQRADILFPVVEFLTNDAWALVRALANGKGFPLLFMDRYSKGVLYVWTMPDNLNDLYRLLPSVISAVKDYVMNGFPVRLDGPNQIALFAYDNNTFIVESYLHTEADARVSVLGKFGKLRNLVTGEFLPAEPQVDDGHRRQGAVEQRTAFRVHVPPHSYSVFAAEQ